jgi:FkbM family methyltransferase
MNILIKIIRTLQASRHHLHPLKYAASRALVKSGLCSHLIIKRNGYRLWFHPSNVSVSMWMQDLKYYAWEESFIQSLLREGDTFVDVGANIGNLTFAGKLKVKGGTVVAIEAHPRTFSFLTSNIALNQLEVDARNVAVGEYPGTMAFSDMHADDCNGISLTGGDIAVLVQTLDTVLEGLGDIRLLKLDIEGYELMALRGAREVLGRTKFVYFEMGDEMVARYSYTPADILVLLNDAGFTVCRILDTGERNEITPNSDFSRLENYLAERN